MASAKYDNSGDVPVSRTITAGAGLTGGGDLSADRTINVVANADASIVVNADDIQVGVLATDAQHGARGGGTQHSAATGSTAGFMSAADKTILGAAGFIVQTSTSAPAGAQVLASLATGIVKSTTTTGVLSIATSGTDYEPALTFSNGLTRTTNTIKNDLNTGVSGGQTALGGTAASDNLTLKGTSHATVGKVIVDASSIFQVNGTTPEIDLFKTSASITQRVWADASGIYASSNVKPTLARDTTSASGVYTQFNGATEQFDFNVVNTGAGIATALSIQNPAASSDGNTVLYLVVHTGGSAQLKQVTLAASSGGKRNLQIAG